MKCLLTSQQPLPATPMWNSCLYMELIKWRKMSITQYMPKRSSSFMHFVSHRSSLTFCSKRNAMDLAFIPSSAQASAQLILNTSKVIQLHSASFSFIQLYSASFSFIQVPSGSFRFLQVPSGSFSFIQLPSASFNFFFQFKNTSVVPSILTDWFNILLR